jgi:hypothetical protein
MKNESSPFLSPEIAAQTSVAPLSSAPGASRVSWRDGRLALGVAAGYLLFFQIAQQLPFHHISVVAFTTLLSLCITLLLTVCIARAIRSSGLLLGNLALSLVLAAPSVLIPLLLLQYQDWPGWPALLSSKPHQWYVGLLQIPGLRGLFLVWFAASLGVTLARLVREFKILLPMAVALALVDLYVVFGGGLVAQAQSGQAPAASVAMQRLTVNLPRPQQPRGAAPMNLSVGFADYLFVALFFACFARFGIPSRWSFIVLCGVLVAYMLVVAFRQVDLPALIPIAAVVIGMNLRRFRYTRDEAIALAVVGTLLVGVLSSLWYFSRR